MNKRQPKSLSELVAECQQGKQKSWHELIDLVAPVILSICRRSRLSRDESFDILGQVCFELVKGIDSVQQPEKLASLVATITRRQIYNLYRKMRLVEFLDDDALASFPADDNLNPEKLFENTRKREILLDAMLDLSERDCRLLKALFLDPQEPSYEQIARDLKMPVASIGPTRARALAALYKILKKKRYDF